MDSFVQGAGAVLPSASPQAPQDQAPHGAARTAGRLAAIVGCSCRLPGAPDEAAFWSLLARGECAVSAIPADRWAHERFLHPARGVAGRTYTFAAGALDDIYGFDPGAFGLSPREAEQIDPQQRLLLELVREAFEDANIPLSSVVNAPVGVFVGASSLDHSLHFVSDIAAADAHFVTGNALSIIANRISHVFSFTGPSLAIDTACSSSLVAFDRAVRAIETGEIDTAVVAGVNVLASPFNFVGFARAGMLSPTGLCRPFSGQADGYVRAEGGVVTILRRLDTPRAMGATPRAVVVATGTNSDGRTLGIAMPESRAQQRLLEELYAARDIDPDTLAFVEAHGTGTLVGDPAEARAVGAALGQRRRSPLPIGSVKSNIGHLEPASGLAGLLKALGALERGHLPASLHLDTLNPHIDFAALNLAPATEASALPVEARLAGISSFGFGGTNAHVVIRLPEAHELPAPGPAPAARVLMISAHSAPALSMLAERYAERLEGEVAPGRLAHAAAHGRARLDHRLAVSVNDPHAASKLRAIARNGGEGALLRGTMPGTGTGVAFVFTGNGGQYAGMGRAAWQASAAFRARVEEIDSRFEPLAGWSLAGAFQRPPDEATLAATEIAQPLIFALEIALARVLMEAGCRPAAVLGHSVGEIAAAHISGALTLADAVHLIHWRSRLQGRTRGTGLMAFLMASPTRAAELIGAARQPDVVIAAFNAPKGVTLSGPAAGIDAVLRLARRQGVVGKRLGIDYPFHSPGMSELYEPMIEVLAGLKPRAPVLPFISAVTGGPITDDSLDSGYWWDNIRHPVMFDAAIRTAAQDNGIGIFLEIGPKAVLTGFVREILADAGRPATVLASLQEKDGQETDKSGEDPIERTLLAALASGAAMDEEKLFGPAQAPGRFDLPKTPWQRQTIRPPRSAEAIDLTGAGVEDHPLLGIRLDGERREWRGLIDIESRPFLADHKVGGHVVVPATGLAEMALAAGHAAFGRAWLRLEDFDILAALRLTPGESVETRVRLESEGGVLIHARPRGAREWVLHARGRVIAEPNAPAPQPVTQPPLRDGDERPDGGLDAEALYAAATRLGLDYGPAFRLVRRARRTGATIELDLAPATVPNPSYILSPTLADAALHGLVLAADALPAAGGMAYLPVRFAALTTRGTAPPAHATLTVLRASPRALALDVVLRDGAGAEVAHMEGVELRAVALATEDELEHDFRQSLVRLGPARSEAHGRIDTFLASREEAPTADDALLLDALAYSIAHRAVIGIAGKEAVGKELAGADLPPDGSIDPAALIARGRLSPERRTSLIALLTLLAEGGLARRTAEGNWHVLADSDLPPPGPLLTEIAALAPDRAAELALGARLAEDLAAHLRGELTIAHPAGLAEHWESASPAARQITADARALTAACIGSDKAPLAVLLVERHGTVLEALRDLVDAGAITLQVLPADEAARLRLTDRIRPSSGITLCEETALPAADLILHTDPRQTLDPAGEMARRLATALRPGGALIGLTVAGSGFARLLAADAQAVGGRRLHGARAVTEITLLTAAQDATTQRPTLEQGLAALLDAEAHGCLISGHGYRIDPDRAALEGAGSAGLLLHRLTARDSAASLAAAMDDARTLLEMLRALGSAPALHLLLDGTPLGGAPATAALWAFGRAASNEYPDLAIKLIGLASPVMDTRALGDLARAIADLPLERELVVGPEGLHAVRLAPAAPEPTSREEAAMRLVMERPGSLDRLAWRPQARRAPGAGEVEIAIAAAALNFRDVMFAQGLIGDDMLAQGFAGATLGFEGGGTVTRIGPGVTGIAEGDAIVAFAPGAFATHATIPAAAVLNVPAGMSIEAAATLPVAFLTAWYGLVECARLAAGESVLIHGAAGGVGLAAMQIAKARGARIIATAGSPEKRALARLFGADIVHDSRDTAFATQIAAEGGCDVVLNSLAGRGMELSLRALKPFGRFIELGKRDFVANTSLGLRPFARNLTYFGVDADQLIAGRPALIRSMLAELAALFAAGTLRPLPYRLFAADAVRSAFRLMQGSGHVGKILIRPPSAVAAEPKKARFNAAPEGVHLVVGGTGGFGRETARWLAAQGARHVVVASRRGVIEPPLLVEGATFVAEPLDVRDTEACADLIARLRARHGRLAGIVHTAMVLDDALIRDLDRDRMEAVLAPKVEGARNLDAATAGLDLDYFVLFSSATTLVGNPGQSAYVAANAYLEGLARRRRAEGRPALAMAWGAIADAGVLARDAATSQKLSRRLGLGTLTAAAALDHLGTCLADPATPPVVVHAPVDWRAARELAVMRGATFAALRSQGDAANEDASDDGIAARIEGQSDSEALASVLRLLTLEVSRILRLPADSIDPARPLGDIGMDSLMALELDMEMQRRHKVALPVLGLGAGATLQDVAGKLLLKLRPDTRVESEAPPAPGIHLPLDETGLIDRHLQMAPTAPAVTALRARIGAESRHDGSLLR
ncbi:acyl transferase domain-containing protein/NADPH:quinone reductase-like Zn-dependent oxidoreductase [Angulomicrobium tetraedrale]|uniref:Acyl transferase domain-containing protein/NADPH:quinone reductase-like Zn-dependent oxidoreductase n=1 Tax=Ancylobacter tetraedralis TaxID=217068 RepID=A0A839ZGJ8_9HYPH|nr:type I polyketide synthase [Ancylobacter tetraedralis]MBB3773685.1 acyl transferase domain-containing protein/NADPH:quinone reductase-like Zn-dependent oxidoreductase [Ancylobacter tetraedralis]